MEHVHLTRSELLSAIRTLEKLYRNTREGRYREVQEGIARYAVLVARFGSDLTAEDARAVIAEYRAARRAKGPLA